MMIIFLCTFYPIYVRSHLLQLHYSMPTCVYVNCIKNTFLILLMLKWLLSTKNTVETQTVTTRLFSTYLTLSTHLSLKIKIEDNYFCWFCTNEFCSQVCFDVKIKTFCLIWTRLKDLWVLKNRCNWIYHLMKYLIHIFARVSILNHVMYV